MSWPPGCRVRQSGCDTWNHRFNPFKRRPKWILQLSFCIFSACVRWPNHRPFRGTTLDLQSLQTFRGGRAPFSGGVASTGSSISYLSCHPEQREGKYFCMDIDEAIERQKIPRVALGSMTGRALRGMTGRALHGDDRRERCTGWQDVAAYGAAIDSQTCVRRGAALPISSALFSRAPSK